MFIVVSVFIMTVTLIIILWIALFIWWVVWLFFFTVWWLWIWVWLRTTLLWILLRRWMVSVMLWCFPLIVLSALILFYMLSMPFVFSIFTLRSLLFTWIRKTSVLFSTSRPIMFTWLPCRCDISIWFNVQIIVFMRRHSLWWFTAFLSFTWKVFHFLIQFEHFLLSIISFSSLFLSNIPFRL
jgi:hypothetical protein